MSPPSGELGALWRVGYYAAPLGYTPWQLYQFNHRFDDTRRRFRTLYCAQSPETCLREVLADFRPNLAAMRRHVERYGPEAAHRRVFHVDGRMRTMTRTATAVQ